MGCESPCTCRGHRCTESLMARKKIRVRDKRIQVDKLNFFIALLVAIAVVHVHDVHKAPATSVALKARVKVHGAGPRGAPRASVCFFGLTRSLEYVKDTIRGNILDVLTRHGWEYDVYLHTYNQTTLSNPRSRELNVTLDTDAWKLLHAKRFIVEDPTPVKLRIDAELPAYLKHGDAFNEPVHYSSLRNLLLQYHSLQQVTGLWKESDYDVVLYLRPDMWYFNPLNMTHFAAAATQPHSVYVPSDNSWWKDIGVNDRVAFGHPGVMKVYGNRGLHAKVYAQHHPLHSESYAKYALEYAGITIFHTDLLAARVRATGVMWGIPELINGAYEFPYAFDPKLPEGHYHVAKTAPLSTWTAIRCNGTTADGSRC